MKVSILALFVASLALLSGCAKTMMLNDPALYDQYLTRSYNQPHDACYNAVIRTFYDRGVELTKADPMEGRIVTERHVAAIYAGYGVIGAISHRYYIDVKGNKDQCTIKVTKYKAWKGDNEVPDVQVDAIYSYYWAPLFGGFESNFEEDEDEIRSGDDILAVLNQHRPEFDDIHQKYMKKAKKNFEGIIALKFTIAPAGNIIDISIEKTTTGELEFDQQIKKAVSMLNFGAVSGGNKTVIIPISFTDKETDSSKNGGRRVKGDGSGGIGNLKASEQVDTQQSSDVKVTGNNRMAADIMKVVKQRTPALRNIYNKYLEKDPAFEGKVVLKFTIGTNGDVLSISIVSSSTNNDKFDKEIKKKVSSWNFGKAEGGNTTVTIPFTFSE